MLMRCRRTPIFVVYMLFISSVFCSVALMFYIQFSSLPQRFIKHHVHHRRLGCNPCITNQGDPADEGKQASHSEQDTMPLPLIDFKDLGSHKKKVLLLIIVSTAPQRFDRRQAIRDTWWKHCNGGQVKCIFMTDGFIVDHAQRDFITQERNKYKDVELQPLLGGREFGLRFLNQIKWAMAKFYFRYLLRIDDDYFLCLKRLLSELPTRPKRNLVWGHFHCTRHSRITWVDEAFMIFTRDMIRKFLSQNESGMLCHPHADQQVGLWLTNITKRKYFHDSRLYHHPPASFSRKFDSVTNVCDKYLGIHGTYVEKMRYFGKNANDNRKGVYPIPKFSSFCRTTRFDYRVMDPRFLFEPKPCINNPTWNVERKMFLGRESQLAEEKTPA